MAAERAKLATLMRAAAVAGCCLVTARLAHGAEPIDVNEPAIRALLKTHCLDCHSGDKPKGDLALDRLSFDFQSAPNRRLWTAALERIELGEMPPKDRPQPTAAEIATISGWIGRRAAEAESAERAAQGRVVLRRLNRTEYENTLRDLLGVELRLKGQLPSDGSADGFDNASTALHTSAFLMERYLEAADAALAAAIANLPQPKLVEKRIDPRQERHIQLTSEKVFRKLDNGVVMFSSSAWQAIPLYSFYPSDGGSYRFRMSVAGHQSNGKPVTFRVAQTGSPLTGKSGLVGYFDAPADKPTVIEFVTHMEPKKTLSILPYGLASAQAVNKVGADQWEGPGLLVEWIEITGPLFESWPPESHRRLFGELKQAPAPVYNQSKRVEVASDDPVADAERILRRFARRAFRRQVRDEDVRPFVAVVERRLAEGASFEQAVRAGLKGVLMSPNFLFLQEKPGKLDDFALASRLSYFLWSTMPDERLLELAEAGKLRDGGVLHGEVERMLADPKAAAFTENFVGQWLGLRDIDFTEPSHILYPEFDHLLKVSMIRETELFFDELLNNDLSVANFVSSDFTMLNGRLAKHYGVPGPDGWEFERTRLAPESHRGGVLTMASVLKVTANGTTTSPVVRGAWVLDRILGQPPAPPPDDVPIVQPDIRGATTIREQLNKHRSVERCNSCHAKIDPPGFALESFDCIGGWRENYRATGNGQAVVIDGRRMPYLKGKPVDSSGVAADGRAFAGIDEFKKLLLEDQDQVARALAVRLVAYGTGAAPTAGDREQVNAIVERARGKGYGLRSLMHAVVESPLFQTK